MNEKILLFIPMYNCEKQIPRVIDKINDEVQGLVSEVLIVDNRSPDNSIERAKEALQSINKTKTKLIKNDDNYSLGGSIKVAFNYALENKFDYMITLHGDDQGDIRDLIPVLKSGEFTNYDIVIGSRFHKESTLKGYSLFRTLGNKVFNIVYGFVTGQKISDMIAGLNIFKLSYLSDQYYLRFPNNLTFDAHLLLYTIYKKRSFHFVPITWREEDQISNAKVFKQGMIILRLLLKYFFLRGKLFKNMDDSFAKQSYTSQIEYQKAA